MEPFSALAIATGVVAFVDFGAKLVVLYRQIRQSEDGRPAALAALEAESQELSRNASHARDRVASLQAKYPRQSESLSRLASECALAEKQLRSLVGSLTANPGQGFTARSAQALVSFRSFWKQGEIENLEEQLRSIREQTMMAIMMCILDDIAESSARLNSLDNDVGEVLSILRPMKTAISERQPGFRNFSRGRPLPATLETERLATGLWTSISLADQAGPDASPSQSKEPISLENDDKIYRRVLEGLEFEDMKARESQIQEPFPETFQWLLNDKGPESDDVSGDQPMFKQWLESQDNETPFWITGNPASGKSTLMKFICTKSQVRERLRLWSPEARLLICSVYFWNPGSLGQKSQVGLLLTILHQLLCQRPDYCRLVAPTRYMYFQLAGVDAPEPPVWTVEELQDRIIYMISNIKSTDRLAMFVDGLDEYEGELGGLVSFLKRLHRDHNVKLCVSSRPWNIFKDEFDTYPSLRMEVLTKPDIEKYVRTRMGNSRAFQELRAIDDASVEELESRIIGKADGVFLWVVLVVEKIITTARDDNDLQKIWGVFNTLPPGLEDLYASMRRRLDPSHLKDASKMYQLLFRWNEILPNSPGTRDFWAAINCHDPTTLPSSHTKVDDAKILSALERRLAGCTGGMLQVLRVEVQIDDSTSRTITTVEFLHRTVFDWLQASRATIINDGPTDYDPSLVLVSGLVSQLNLHTEFLPSRIFIAIQRIFAMGRDCRDSPEHRAKLLRIIEQLPIDSIRDLESPIEPEHIDAALNQSDSTLRSYLATRFACAPYLQAKLENSPHTTGLEFPRRLHIVPTPLWEKTKRQWLSVVIDATLTVSQDDPNHVLNMRLKIFETLVRIQFAPPRALASRIEENIKRGRWPKEYWKILLAGLRGEGFSELTSIGEWDEPGNATLQDIRDELQFLKSIKGGRLSNLRFKAANSVIMRGSPRDHTGT